MPDNEPPSSASGNRIAANFFGSPSLYNQPRQKKLVPTQDADWNNPPPPPYSPSNDATYSLAPNEPPSSASSIPANPSAPPLEPMDSPYPSTQYPLPQSFGGYHSHPNQYGTIPQQPYPNVTHTTSDANWPWSISPSEGSQPQSSPPQQHYYYNTQQKRPKTCCELLLKYLFYFFCICLVIRLIELLSGNAVYSGTCPDGMIWDKLPDHINFSSDGLKIQVVNGHLSAGQINLKRIDDTDRQEGIVTGTIKATVLVSPNSLINDPGLDCRVVHSSEGTLLEIKIPQHYDGRSCVSLNADIYLPDSLSHLHILATNVKVKFKDTGVLKIDQLYVRSSNEDIEMGSEWQGQTSTLTTTNAKIYLEKTMTAVQDVTLETTNSKIQLKQPIKAGASIRLITKNDVISTEGLLDAPVLEMTTTNGAVRANQLKASQSKIKTTNGRVVIANAKVEDMFHVETSNDLISVVMTESDHSKVSLTTTNGDIDVIMPVYFQGGFELESSQASKFIIEDPLHWAKIEFYQRGQTRGTRYSNEYKDLPKLIGHLTSMTSHGYIRVVYGPK
ncbi:uncharacterized protein B0P05DRAFT_37324 [Gilbertella persicaria]|uniref:uncharacterized protein n=1 Tax=Gilbertella persicaria TaxID=101096 RepID=UPI002220CFD4|nr:uncharacterized protein B0P05DRAFT_37324 [Gilbertella persicaria]KAI8084403.1 hypothetical protein B0P05DRAFT_37324 [Gilbertella persicaria]